jgi:hypothetical protein
MNMGGVEEGKRVKWGGEGGVRGGRRGTGTNRERSEDGGEEGEGEDGEGRRGGEEWTQWRRG